MIMKRLVNQPILRLLLVCLTLIAGSKQLLAWDTAPDANGKYDEYYDRPTHFPDFQQPTNWPNAQYYVVSARLGENGPRLENYEVAVYDQNNTLRHCNRSMQKDDHLCVLTIRGEEGDMFHCQIIYGDFEHPTIIDVPETFGFKTNDIVGTVDDPFCLNFPGCTYLSEQDAQLPDDKATTHVIMQRTINGDEWSTICLPFAMSAAQVSAAFGDDAQLADFTGCEVEYEDDEETVKSISVKFQSVTAIEANHPYIIKVRESITQFEADDVSIQATDEPSVDCDEYTVGKGKTKQTFYNRFVGNYVNGFMVPSQCLFLSGGKFWYSTGKTQMMSYRAYFDFYEVLPETMDSAARITISIDEEPTGIISVNQETKNHNHYYDLQGRSIQHPSKGLYISGGRKYLIK